MNVKKAVFSILLSIFTIFSTFSNVFSYDNYKLEENTNKNSSNDALKEEFQTLLKDLFNERNNAVVSFNCENLKKFYNLDIKASLWAYESENIKIQYLKNWAEKQGVVFNNIQSTVKVTKVKEKEKNLFEVVCLLSTEFDYSYLDNNKEHNKFKLGTSHYLNLRKIDDKYVITKEWYKDPFADSLDLNNINSEEIKEYILSKNKPEISLNEKTNKAIEYAHRFCGVSDEEEYLFKYNKEYTNFNPEGGDCANFASQILYESGLFKKNNLWNYSNKEGSKAWINAQGFKNYMVNSGRASYITKGSYKQVYKDAYNLRPGDFVAYEKGGKIVHISVVTGLDSKGYPLVTCHNTDRLLVPYDLGWSNPNIKFHLINVHN